MRILAGISMVVLLFASANLQADDYRNKDKKANFQDDAQVSRSQYSRATTKRTYVDPNKSTVRSPERHKVEGAPKAKLRRKSHITEGPL